MARAESRDHSAARGDAVVEARHAAGARALQRGDDAGEVIRPDAHVAVGQHDHVVVDASFHVDEVRHLVVEPVPAAVDDEGGGYMRQGLDQLRGDRRSSIPRVLHAEDDLDGPGIILSAEREQIVGQPRLIPVQGLQDRDGRMLGGGSRRPLREAADEDRRRAKIKASGRRDDEAGEGEPERHDRSVRCRPPLRSACANAPRGPPVRPSSARRRTPSGAPPAC